jgi:hypothetical protein
MDRGNSLVLFGALLMPEKRTHQILSPHNPIKNLPGSTNLLASTDLLYLVS